MKKILLILILNLCFIFGSMPFKGYIKYGKNYNQWIYAEGQYLDGFMDGEWLFYSDSTKTNMIAKGGYLNGNTSNSGQYGIPKHGRNGLWEHYYISTSNYYNGFHLKNPKKSTQYWNDGKLSGKFISFFKDGKIAIECDYKDGKKNGHRKEWFQGGYMYTNLYRDTEYKNGNPIRDKIYDYGNTTLSLQSSYIDDTRIDTLYSSNHKKKLISRQIKNGFYHGRFIAYHPNGSIWIKGAFDNGNVHGDWKEYSDTGNLMVDMKYDKGTAIINDGDRKKIYDLDGKLIYSYQFIDGKRNGKSIEMLHNVPSIIHNLEINKMRATRCYYSSTFQEYSYSYSIDTQFQDTKNLRRQYIHNSIPYLDPYVARRQYDLYWNHFGGFIQRDTKYNRSTKNKIIGIGTYANNIRVGAWTWKTLEDDKIAITGQYNDNGIPVGKWKEVDPKDDNNLIITQYDSEGKIESVSKQSITYLNK